MGQYLCTKLWDHTKHINYCLKITLLHFDLKFEDRLMNFNKKFHFARCSAQRFVCSPSQSEYKIQLPM